MILFLCSEGSSFMAGADMGPDATTEEGRARLQKGKESTAALTAYMADLIQGFLTEPQDNVLSKLVNDTDGPDGPMLPKEAAANVAYLKRLLSRKENARTDADKIPVAAIGRPD